MSCLMEKKSFSFEQFLQSEILLYCIKKCLLKPDISPEVKLKISFLLYEKNFDYKEKYADCILKNPLGIDDDLFEKPSESLSIDQVIELRKLMFDEIKKFYAFFSSLRRAIKYLSVKDHPRDTYMALKTNLNKQILALNESQKSQPKIESIKSEACSSLEERFRSVIRHSKQHLSASWKLYRDIYQEITADGRCQSLEDVEEILEKKIDKNRKKIEEIKFKLSEFTIL